ncbi:uncharacterized protein MONBRDRAFT_37161 [Monosiga brevicollis MX1]|uniref:Uncharacterized protein n=1 Tax=Monosiga brevicollis TaxID=81824 RepID=A9UZZ8_MONBE|nr:uncharacterized protein MONBRDRAFT_37161 [Monosiga brevicollis MX1]EDQ89067.1 predicted protein [Monosiga brevicollis MX1]|eukprot:XP_001746172.1 hypothetical protein [Monosiga brevicollis MX1]
MGEPVPTVSHEQEALLRQIAQTGCANEAWDTIKVAIKACCLRYVDAVLGHARAAPPHVIHIPPKPTRPEATEGPAHDTFVARLAKHDVRSKIAPRTARRLAAQHRADFSHTSASSLLAGAFVLLDHFERLPFTCQRLTEIILNAAPTLHNPEAAVRHIEQLLRVDTCLNRDHLPQRAEFEARPTNRSSSQQVNEGEPYPSSMLPDHGEADNVDNEINAGGVRIMAAQVLTSDLDSLARMDTDLDFDAENNEGNGHASAGGDAGEGLDQSGSDSSHDSVDSNPTGHDSQDSHDSQEGPSELAGLNHHTHNEDSERGPDLDSQENSNGSSTDGDNTFAGSSALDAAMAIPPGLLGDSETTNQGPPEKQAKLLLG